MNWLSEDSVEKTRVRQLEERVKELEAKLTEAESKKETQLLKQRIAQLESTLSRYKEELETAKRRISEMQAPYRDVETKLKEIIGDSGEVTLQYGGYRIIILDKYRFPWSQVVELVLDNHYEMWLGKDDKHLFICCKPISD
jgi:DNA repair exonuclease SbcCD ATPase subunit